MERGNRAVYKRQRRNVRPRVGEETVGDQIANPSVENSKSTAQRARRSASQHVQVLPRGTMTIDGQGAAQTTGTIDDDDDDDDEDDEVEDETYKIDPTDAGDEDAAAILHPPVR